MESGKKQTKPCKSSVDKNALETAKPEETRLTIEDQLQILAEIVVDILFSESNQIDE